MWSILKKVTVSVYVFTLLVLILSACNSANSEKNQGDVDVQKVTNKREEKIVIEEKIKIGFSMDTLEEERWLKDRELFRKAVEALGAEVDILASEGDDALQILQAETLIHQGIDVLVIVPHNAESTAIIVKKAHAAGIKVLAYDRLVKNSEVDLYISYDNEMVGELQAKTLINLVPEGNYVFIGGAETDNNAHLVKKGVFHVLQPLIDNGEITIVYDQWTKDWLPTNAFTNMQEALKANQNKVDAVIAGNDATAGAVILALNEAGMEDVPVVGQDAELAAVQRIVADEQAMTVYKPIRTLTQKAAELAVQLAKGEDIEVQTIINNGKSDVPSILLEPIAVDSSNMEETVIADGFHTREEIYTP